MSSIIPNRSVIEVTGDDATKFLHNLVTNDILSLRVNASQYAMMLSPQGRFLFDMFVVKTSEGYLLDIFTGTNDLLLKKLNLYKLGLKVEIKEKKDLYVVYYPLSNPSKIENKEIYYKDTRHEMMGYRSLTSSLGKANNVYFLDKYKYAIPDGGIDLLYDKAIPQEYGAEELNAICYTKGCYIGQEAISRTKTQGVVRKKIYKISSTLDFSSIAHGVEVMADGNKIGIFCSGYGTEGIALIREENLHSAKDEFPTIEGHNIILQIADWYNS